MRYFTFFLLALIACTRNEQSSSNQVIYGAGTLGSVGTYKGSCDKEYVYNELDSIESFCEQSIPIDLQEFNNLDEQGYDFLTHWTFYHVTKMDTFYYWVSASENSIDPALGIRSIFMMKTQVWKKAINMNEFEKDQFNRIFEDSVLSKIDCDFTFSSE